MENYKIYCHIFPNGKRYYGQTKQPLKNRFGANGINYKDTPLLWNAINKYGWDNIIHELIKDNLTKEEADYYEKLYIKEYKTNKREYGYNMTMGGEGNSLYDYKEIYEYYLKEKNVKNTAQKFNCSEVTIVKALQEYGITGVERIKNSAGKYHLRDIHSYSLSGEYIESFNSIGEAAKALNIIHTNIIKAAQGERKSAGGRRWSYEKVDKLNTYFYQGKTNKIKPIEQYSLQGDYIATFPSASSAAESLGKKGGESNILRTCKGQFKQSYGYIWKYKSIC